MEDYVSMLLEEGITGVIAKQASLESTVKQVSVILYLEISLFNKEDDPLLCSLFAKVNSLIEVKKHFLFYRN